MPFRTRLPDALVVRLGQRIRGGDLGPGDRLPSEHTLVGAFGVSRAVVREAIQRLKAEGLVVSHQGRGAFVAPAARQAPFRLDPTVADSLNEAVRIMELRGGVEVEAAGLAAENRSSQQLARSTEALARIDQAIAAGEPAVREDFALHRAIAAATGNPYFVRFLDYLGHHIIPRWTVLRQSRGLAARRSYLLGIQAEHRRIVAAIAAGDPAAARRAMRHHLVGSRLRYRRMTKALDARHIPFEHKS